MVVGNVVRLSTLANAVPYLNMLIKKPSPKRTRAG